MGQLKIDRIRETFVNETKGHRIGESDYYEPYTDDIGELFRNSQKEYGRCTGKMYQDMKAGYSKVCGWVFEKRIQYSDSNETFLQTTWLHIRYKYDLVA